VLPVVLLCEGNGLGNQKVSLIPEISVVPRDKQQHASIFLARWNMGCAVECEMYSASVDDKAMWVCNFEVHTKGQPAYVITKPVRERAVSLSFGASTLSQFPEKSAST
jgi:hypothetical protein